MANGFCAECGKPLPPWSGRGRQRRFCSRACNTQLKNRLRRENRRKATVEASPKCPHPKLCEDSPCSAHKWVGENLLRKGGDRGLLICVHCKRWWRLFHCKDKVEEPPAFVPVEPLEVLD